jgi:hypothetical protein
MKPGVLAVAIMSNLPSKAKGRCKWLKLQGAVGGCISAAARRISEVCRSATGT